MDDHLLGALGGRHALVDSARGIPCPSHVVLIAVDWVREVLLVAELHRLFPASGPRVSIGAP
jgi:hypothetical protein